MGLHSMREVSPLVVVLFQKKFPDGPRHTVPGDCIQVTCLHNREYVAIKMEQMMDPSCMCVCVCVCMPEVVSLCHAY